MRVAFYLSGRASGSLLQALILLAPVLFLSIAAKEMSEGADWAAVVPHRFVFAALLRALPMVAIPAALLGAIWSRASFDRNGETFLFALLGYSPLRVATWASLPTLLLSLVLLFLSWDAVPRASMALASPAGLSAQEVSRWLVYRKERAPEGTLFIGAGAFEEAELTDLRMASAHPRIALRAERASIDDRVESLGKMDLDVEEGSLLLPQIPDTPLRGGVIRFEHGQMRLDPMAIAHDGKRRFQRVAETPSSNLRRDAALLERIRGAETHVAKLRYESVRRVLLAFLPFFLVWILHLRWSQASQFILNEVRRWPLPASLFLSSVLPLALARNSVSNGLSVLGVTFAAASILLPLCVVLRPQN